MAKTVRTVLVGLGHVNLGLLSILIAKEKQIAKEYGLHFKIVGAIDSSGMAVSEKGFGYEELTNIKFNKGKLNETTGFVPQPVEGIADCIDADLLVDASPVNLVPKNPGVRLVKKALPKGWRAVFANKSPLVLAYDELNGLAREHKTKILFSATVCGGLPVINVLRRDLKLASLINLHGVFNATSNFVLQEMENGGTMEAALEEAKRVGAAETDPTLDISGQDTANKLYIMMKSFTNFNGLIKDIAMEGIDEVTPEKLLEATKNNCTIKLVASAYYKGHWHLSVKPTLVARDSFLGSCNGWEMGLEVKTDLYESVSMKNFEADPKGTSAAVLRDMIDLCA